jgi:hypothetical protein
MQHLAPVSRDHWLENPRKISAAARKRRKDKGKRSTSGGSTMPRRRRRRRTAAVRSAPRRRRRRRNPVTARANPARRRRRRRRNPATAAVASNPRRRRRRRAVHSFARRRYRRNPSFSVRGVIGQAKRAGSHRRSDRRRQGRNARHPELHSGRQANRRRAHANANRHRVRRGDRVGYLASMFLGARVGANFMAGGFVGVVESLIKTYKVPIAADALGDDGDPNVITVPAHMGGYVRNAIARGRYVRQDGADVNGPGLGAYGRRFESRWKFRSVRGIGIGIERRRARGIVERVAREFTQHAPECAATEIATMILTLKYAAKAYATLVACRVRRVRINRKRCRGSCSTRRHIARRGPLASTLYSSTAASLTDTTMSNLPSGTLETFQFFEFHREFLSILARCRSRRRRR